MILVDNYFLVNPLLCHLLCLLGLLGKYTEDGRRQAMEF